VSAATSRLGALLFALCFNHLNTISEARRARIGHTLDTAEIVVGAAPLEFLELDTPTHEDIADVAARTATRVEKILRAHGRSLDPALADETPPGLAVDEPTLAALYAAAAQGIGVSGERAGLPPLRLITAPPDRPRARDVTDAPSRRCAPNVTKSCGQSPSPKWSSPWARCSATIRLCAEAVGWQRDRTVRAHGELHQVFF
jgi:hypothetical protein